jgi:hypothetical protein
MYSMQSTNSATEPLHDQAERPVYPEGLKLHLDSDTLRKLAMSRSDFQVGMELPICGSVLVTGIAATPKQIRGADTSVTLQITSLDIGDDAEPELEAEAEPMQRSLAERMFCG